MLILTDCRVISDAAVFFSSKLRVAAVACQSKTDNRLALNCLVKAKYLLLPKFLISPVYYFNVSSTNSEQSKLCINGPLYIDAWLLWEQAIGSNGT